MKRILSLVLLAFSFALASNAQTPSSTPGAMMTAGEDALHARLQLETSIADVKYCTGDTVVLELRFNFTNDGKNPVILDKRSSVVGAFMVSRTLRAALAEKHETVGHLMTGSAHLSFDPAPDDSLFTILQPGQAYSPPKLYKLTIENGKDQEHRLAKGNHFLQIVVETWYYARLSNIEWRGKWNHKGYLWTDPLLSNPMPFTVKSGQQVCR